MNFVLKDINETMTKLNIKRIEKFDRIQPRKLNAYLESIKPKETPKQNTVVQEQSNNTSNIIIDENKALELAKVNILQMVIFLRDQ